MNTGRERKRSAAEGGSAALPSAVALPVPIGFMAAFAALETMGSAGACSS